MILGMRDSNVGKMLAKLSRNLGTRNSKNLLQKSSTLISADTKRPIKLSNKSLNGCSPTLLAPSLPQIIKTPTTDSLKIERRRRNWLQFFFFVFIAHKYPIYKKYSRVLQYNYFFSPCQPSFFFLKIRSINPLFVLGVSGLLRLRLLVDRAD